MKTHHGLMISLGALAMVGVGCSDDMMSMSDEIDGLAIHQAALESDLTSHHQDVLAAGDPAHVRSLETGFGRISLGHMDEMDHRMSDMQGMCSMNGQGFDGAAMSNTMSRVRTGLGDHQRRMADALDVAAMRAEEGSFRDQMISLMAEMRGRQTDVRSSASQYTCRMHGH